ncbi:MAG: polysaccharide deacetylase family protein [candidate division WOR-3 bacterium]
MCACILTALLCGSALSDSLFLQKNTVVLSADDGHYSIYTNVYPLLRRYGMTITLALIANTLMPDASGYSATGSSVSIAQVREMLDSCGIEIASHTLSHPFLTRLDSSAAWSEIWRSKVILESIFDVPVITFVYPYGDMDVRIRHLVRQAGYRLARAVRHGEIDFWNDCYRLPEFELRREVSLEAVQDYIRKRRNSIILFHRIVERPAYFTEWPVDKFSELLDWLNRHGARTTTIAGLYNDWWRDQIATRLAEASSHSVLQGWLFKEVDVDATGTAHTRRVERLHVLLGP